MIGTSDIAVTACRPNADIAVRRHADFRRLAATSNCRRRATTLALAKRRKQK